LPPLFIPSRPVEENKSGRGGWPPLFIPPRPVEKNKSGRGAGPRSSFRQGPWKRTGPEEGLAPAVHSAKARGREQVRKRGLPPLFEEFRS